MSNLESFDLNYLLLNGAKVTRECYFIMSMIRSSQFYDCEGPIESQEKADKIVRERRELGRECHWQFGIYEVEFKGFTYRFDNETRRMIKQSAVSVH